MNKNHYVAIMAGALEAGFGLKAEQVFQSSF